MNLRTLINFKFHSENTISISQPPPSNLQFSITLSDNYTVSDYNTKYPSHLSNQNFNNDRQNNNYENQNDNNNDSIDDDDSYKPVSKPIDILRNCTEREEFNKGTFGIKTL